MELLRPKGTLQWARTGLIVVGITILTGCASAPVRPPPPDPRLQSLVPPSRDMEILGAALSSPNPREREAALLELAGAKNVAEDTHRLIRQRLTDESSAVREAAAWAVGFLPGAQGSFDTDVTPPRLIRQVKPTYPRYAFDHKIEGTVELRILIGEAGSVTRIAAMHSIPWLDSAAIDCVTQWSFEPARRGGRPVPIVATAPVTFRIY